MAVTDTRNQSWANDKSKFGYKMLQKMGWTEGKGLGAKEDGTTQHIRIRRKTTNAGVGGETNVDAWNKPAQVAAGLSAVLARLAPVNCEKATVKAEKVGKKGRGYHQRRSAGKNVSGYTEGELREIFGGINVDRKKEEGKRSISDGKTDGDGDERETEEQDCLDNHNVGNVDTLDGTKERRSTKSKRKQDEKAKRKRIDKEKGKKAKSKSLAVEPTIKKAKKCKGKKKAIR